MQFAITSYDKALVAGASLIVAVCAAAGVDVSRPVEALVGVALILLPVAVFYKKNRGVSYEVASKAIAALPAAVAGVFLLFGIEVRDELEQIGQSLLAFLPFVVASVGNTDAEPDY